MNPSFIYIYTHTHTHTHTHIYIYIYIYVCVCVCVCLNLSPSLSVDDSIYIYVCVCVCVCVCMYMYISSINKYTPNMFLLEVFFLNEIYLEFILDSESLYNNNGYYYILFITKLYSSEILYAK